MLTIPADISVELTAVLKELQDAVTALQASHAEVAATVATVVADNATADSAATDVAATDTAVA